MQAEHCTAATSAWLLSVLAPSDVAEDYTMQTPDAVQGDVRCACSWFAVACVMMWATRTCM